jgi:hypothetical protein
MINWRPLTHFCVDGRAKASPAEIGAGLWFSEAVSFTEANALVATSPAIRAAAAVRAIRLVAPKTTLWRRMMPVADRGPRLRDADVG